MTSKRKVVVPIGTAVVAVALVVIGVVMRWPSWATILLVLVCCGVGALVHRAVARERRIVLPEPVHLPPPRPAPEPVQMVAVEGVNLASAWADYEFIFNATVYWRSIAEPAARPHVRPGARAVDTIIQRAAEIAATEPPGMASRLQYRLNDALGVVEPDSSGRIEAWADQVRTALPAADVNHLRTLSEIRKNKEVWQHQRHFECDRRQYLTEDVFQSTGSALIWWLSKHEDDVKQAENLIATMARLSAAAKDEDVSERFRHLLPASLLPPERSVFATVGSDGAGQPVTLALAPLALASSPIELVNALMDVLKIDEDQRTLFAAQVANNIEKAGNIEVADQLRRRFDVIVEEPIVDVPENPETTVFAWPAAADNPRPEVDGSPAEPPEPLDD